MKLGKKFLHRFVAVFCAFVVAVSCLGSVPYYADESSAISVFKSHSSDYYTSVDFDIPYDLVSSYEYYYVFVRDDEYCFLWGTNTPFEYECVSGRNDTSGFTYYNLKTVGFGSSGSLYVKYLDGSVDWKSTSLGSWGIGTQYGIGVSFYEYDNGTTTYNSDVRFKFVESNAPVYLSNDDSVFLSSQKDIYSSSIGYLQNINRQFLYLEDDSFSLVEDTAACRFTFANTTTTGLDITNGNWSIRHYMEIEVKNAKKEYETVEIYDKVYLNEYSASDCKILYKQKDTIERLHEESGFDGLSWWDSNFLGYITYYNDYFQLVRTNEDGSVEYGGYVKVWQDEYNINHSSTLGEDGNQDDSGYNDNIVPGSHGSGDTYEEAEHDADENAANSSNSSGETLDELNNILSTISAVPEAFARMFSFLPDWCLTSIGISIVVGFAIVIWKAGRG